MKPKIKYFITSDNLRIHASLYPAATKTNTQLLILAPGFAQHAGTRTMGMLAEALREVANILVVDFRGNGKSQGIFGFGAQEYLDLEPILKWAHAYPEVSLLGFSLGAYHSIRAALAFPGPLRRLLLVSCPTKLEEIIMSGGAFINPLALVFRRIAFAHRPDNDLFFRYGWPFAKKPSSKELVELLSIPCHFLVGGQDTLVFENLSHRVFTAVQAKKSYTRFDQGVHAEQMFMQTPVQFVQWVKGCLLADETS